MLVETGPNTSFIQTYLVLSHGFSLVRRRDNTNLNSSKGKLWKEFVLDSSDIICSEFG